ncbi:Nse4 C-terminal-domain-containing protein [Leptodontidium sp. 2 PMI_412]|nr:Nse4 C-terminal-domain-containing protein [Leptodontidium sp. 2 PMI_412]
MARATKMSESPAPFHDDLYGASPPPSSRNRRSNNAPQHHSPSPATSVSSDKENRSSRLAVDKGKGRAPMGPPPRVASPSERNKRKRGTDDPLADRSNSRRRTVEVEEDEDEIGYDPEQPLDVRRELRAGMRESTKKLLENRSEYLKPNSSGLKDTLLQANSLFAKVKQTSDATIDSRLLNTVADYVDKKAVAMISGDSSQGIDVDEFVSKLKQFMRLGQDAEEAPTSTERARRDDGEDDGEVLNWAYLGRNACIMHNARPSVPGFLLGPLSLEKRAKRAIARRAGLRQSNAEETRPEVLKTGDVKRDENQNLSALSQMILRTFRRALQKAVDAVDEHFREDMTPQEEQALMDKFSVSNIQGTGGIAYFKFVINPYSFGQSVENMFYVSFLIRDGAVGIATDDRGLPYLILIDENDKAEAEKGEHPKHQAVMALDMQMWEDLIDTFEISEPMIKNRDEPVHQNVGAKGWYA